MSNSFMGFAGRVLLPERAAHEFALRGQREFGFKFPKEDDSIEVGRGGGDGQRNFLQAPASSTLKSAFGSKRFCLSERKP